MSLDVIMALNETPLAKKYLRENSYWYKYLNRSNNYYKEFIKQMKESYKLTTPDKLNKVINDINMFKTILDVFK